MSIQELFCPTCGPGYRYGDDGCKHTPTNDAVAVLVQEMADLRRLWEGRARTYRLALDQLGTEMAEALGRDPAEFPLAYGTDSMIEEIRELVALKERCECDGVVDPPAAEVLQTDR